MAAPANYLIIPAEAIRLVVADGHVLVELDMPTSVTGLLPGVGLAMQLTPTQAAEFARALGRKADEAQAGSPPPSTNRH